MITIDQILNIDSDQEFNALAIELFRFQAQNCEVYKEYLKLVNVVPEQVDSVEQIPFLPIELFKTHKIYCAETAPEIIFTSSNTGGLNPSKHYMAKKEIYEKTFLKAFEQQYGDPANYAIYGLLPNYLQREGSSLVYMVDRLIAQNRQGVGGFYLDDYQKLIEDMAQNDAPKILLGVSYALWDLAEKFSPKLSNTIVMETGGMKGQREELAKDEFHKILSEAFDVQQIHSEYGMAELSSQAYSSGEGVFTPARWMKIMLRDLNDPFENNQIKRGGINIIDLANIYSCAFIQTQDIGRVTEDGRFEVLGRYDHSEIRGCNLLIAPQEN